MGCFLVVCLLLGQNEDVIEVLVHSSKKRKIIVLQLTDLFFPRTIRPNEHYLTKSSGCKGNVHQAANLGDYLISSGAHPAVTDPISPSGGKCV